MLTRVRRFATTLITALLAASALAEPAEITIQQTQRIMYSVRVVTEAGARPGSIMAGALVTVEQETAPMTISREREAFRPVACEGGCPVGIGNTPHVVASFTPVVRDGVIETRVVVEDRVSRNQLLDTTFNRLSGEKFSVKAVQPAHRTNGQDVGETIFRLEIVPSVI